MNVDAALEAGGSQAIQPIDAYGIEFDGTGRRIGGFFSKIAQSDPRDVVVVKADEVVAAGGEGIGDGLDFLRFVGECTSIRQCGTPETRCRSIFKFEAPVGTRLDPAVLSCRSIHQPTARISC